MSNVYVLGSINMDLVVKCDHHPEIGETLIGESFSCFPGGKGANQAIAACRSHGSCVLIGCVAKDAYGDQLIQHLQVKGVDTTYIQRTDSVSTGIASIIVDRLGRNSIVVVPGANTFVNRDELDRAEIFDQNSIGLAQLEVPLEQVISFFAKIKTAGGRTILNPSPYAPLPEALVRNTDIVILNQQEFSQFSGIDCQFLNASTANQTFDKVTLPVPVCIVTLGENGAMVLRNDERPVTVPGQKVEVVDTTGVGDCFAGWFAGKIAKGTTINAACQNANIAASMSVQKMGAGT